VKALNGEAKAPDGPLAQVSNFGPSFLSFNGGFFTFIIKVQAPRFFDFERPRVS